MTNSNRVAYDISKIRLLCLRMNVKCFGYIVMFTNNDLLPLQRVFFFHLCEHCDKVLPFFLI